LIYKNLVLDNNGGVIRMTLSRPEKMNALSVELGEDLSAALNEVEQNPEARVLIITGAGRAFCAGGQLEDVLRANADPWLADRSVRVFLDVVRQIRTLKIPVIARINGDAVGGGCCLALCCDLKVASLEARMGISFVRIGLSGCDMGATYLLPRMIGLTRATEFLMLGAMIPAVEAERLGLINRAVAPDQLDAVVNELADRLCKGPALALQFTKKALLKGADTDFFTEMELEAYIQGLCIQSEDVREGVEALREKRVPCFKGK